MIVAETPGIPSRRRAASSRGLEARPDVGDRDPRAGRRLARGNRTGDGLALGEGSAAGDGSRAGDAVNGVVAVPAATAGTPLEVTATATARPAQPPRPAVRTTARMALRALDQRPGRLRLGRCSSVGAASAA